MADVYATILTHLIAYIVGFITMFFISRNSGSGMETNNQLHKSITDNIDRVEERISNSQGKLDQLIESTRDIENLIDTINQKNNLT